jgi:hypothetical protein
MRTTWLAGLAALGLLFSLAACKTDDRSSATRQSDLGTGLNTVDRNYAKGPEDVWEAASATAKSMGLTIDRDRHDALGGEIAARRGDGQKVNILVKGMDAKNSSVSVRVEPGNVNMAEMVHEKIAEKLGMGQAKGALLGGNMIEGTYGASLASCLSASEQASRKLNYTVIQKEIHDTWAQLDARMPDSNPVRFRFDRSDDKTKATFIAGRGKTDDSKTVLQRMKEEFENQLQQLGD